MLRKLELKDASLMYQTISDESVTKYMNISGKDNSIERCENFIRSSWDDLDNVHFAITDEDDSWVGTISLKHIDRDVNQAEYAIVTSGQVHGKGFAFKATQELLDYAFNVLKLNRVYLNVLTTNARANKFYLKCGFVLEGTFRESINVKGQINDLNWYSMIRKDYEK